MKLEGGCYCGAVRYVVEGTPMMKAQCHCRECQHNTGGSANVFVAFPMGGFTYTKGSPAQFTRSDIPNAVTREFCGTCGAPLLTRSPRIPAVILKVGSLDDPEAVGGPDVAIYTIDKRSFHHIPDGMPAFERLPG
jgi:hypothetical protein